MTYLIVFTIGLILGLFIEKLYVINRILNSNKFYMDIQIRREYKKYGLINAIKLCRILTDKGLKESKDYVEKLCKHNYTR